MASRWALALVYFFCFFNCMFYQLLRVQHGCSSTQSWGSVLPSIVETRDQNSRGCPLLFSNRNLGSFVHRGQKSYTPTAFGKLWTTPGVRCMKHNPSPRYETGPSFEPGTFGLVDECSTTELTVLLEDR